MHIKQRLQVFISSTFSDLFQERQAAVEAVLEAGHIPAGMELFTAGNDAQWKIIQNWIEESDVYMLILGGRYGSIHPRSKRSYTEMEFRFAKGLKKPMFALLGSDKFIEKQKANGVLTATSADFAKSQNFRKIVSNRLVNFFDNRDQLKLFIVRALAELTSKNNIGGWSKSNAAPNEDLAVNHFLFPRTWQVGHGFLPEIEEKHNYRAIVRMMKDEDGSILRIGSPYHLYWVEPSEKSRIQWLLENTHHVSVEVVLFQSARLSNAKYTAKRKTVIQRMRTVAKCFPRRMRFTSSARQTDLSYITYALGEPYSQYCRALIGLQTLAYQDRPFLEFVYNVLDIPMMVSAVHALHREVI